MNRPTKIVGSLCMLLALLFAPLAFSWLCAEEVSPLESRTAVEWVRELRERKHRLDVVDMSFRGAPPPEVFAVEEAKRALASCGEKSVPLVERELQKKVDKDWIEVLEKIGEPAVAVLSQHVRDGKSLVISTLHRLGGKARGAIPALVAVMDDETLAEEAAYTIQHIGAPKPDGVPALMEFAKDARHGFRQGWAIVLLGQIGEDAQGAVGGLGKILVETKDPARARNLILTIGQIGGKEAVAILGERLRVEETGDGGALAVVVEALGETGEQTALPLLTAQLIRRDRFIHTAIPAFRHFGEEAVPYLLPPLESEERDTRERAVRAIFELKEASSAVPQLRRALADSSHGVQAIAAQALGKIGPSAKSCVPDLLRMMEGEPCLSLPLAQISVGSPDDVARVVEALVGVLRNGHKTWQDRENAAMGLGVLGRSAMNAVPALRETVTEFQNSNSCVRVASEEAIRKIDGP